MPKKPSKRDQLAKGEIVVEGPPQNIGLKRMCDQMFGVQQPIAGFAAPQNLPVAFGGFQQPNPFAVGFAGGQFLQQPMMGQIPAAQHPISQFGFGNANTRNYQAMKQQPVSLQWETPYYGESAPKKQTPSKLPTIEESFAKGNSARLTNNAYVLRGANHGYEQQAMSPEAGLVSYRDEAVGRNSEYPPPEFHVVLC